MQARVKAAIVVLADMKRIPQPMAGDSWMYYRRMIAPAWDIELHGITSSSYVKLYKVTYEVYRPDTGFAIMYTSHEWDTPEQNMWFTQSTVRDDPYSWWLLVEHANYNSDSAGISIRFNVFSPQKGEVSVTEV